MQTIEACTLRLKENIEGKIAAGFHHYLGKTEEEYRSDFEKAEAPALISAEGTETSLIWVEPRIPFENQCRMLGYDLDPAVFYDPLHDPKRLPYILQVKVLSGRSGLSIKEIIESLKDGFYPAAPFEGINALPFLGKSEESVRGLAGHVSLAFPGGEYARKIGMTYFSDRRFRTLAAEKYLGRPRITHIYNSTRDSLVGVLAGCRPVLSRSDQAEGR